MGQVRLFKLLRFLSLLGLAISLNACSTYIEPPDLLITGLSFPPGSTIVEDFSNLTDEEYEQKRKKRPVLGKRFRGQKVYVTFRCTGSWESVSNHFDRCLGALGYQEEYTGPGATTDDVLRARSHRKYTMSDGKYEVHFEKLQGQYNDHVVRYQFKADYTIRITETDQGEASEIRQSEL